jgi:hypothetical protein
MEEHERVDREPEEAFPARRTWSIPTLEVLAVGDAAGSANGFPQTDSVTGIS